MSFRPAALAFFLAVAAFSVYAQLPSPQKLSREDDRGFEKELERLRKLLATANDKGAVELQIANTYAAGGQYAKAIRRLRKVVDANLGFDPSRDSDFASLRNTVEFQSIMDEVRRQTPPVLKSRLIATLEERELFPENVAFDPRRKTFFLGSTAKDQIVRCSAGAACMVLVAPHLTEKSYVLGLKIDRAVRTFWATNNSPGGASLRRYDIHSGKLLQTASIEGKHVFNDLALSSSGDVYVTDTSESSVYRLNSRTNALQVLGPPHRFAAANGIAISPDEKMLYVSAWGDGIDVIDLPSGSVKPIAHADSVCLAFIDGLYAIGQSLVAIQNGPMLPRIVQFNLSKNGQQIVGMTMLERRNPAFDGITTGTMVGNELYYVANPQIDKKDSPNLSPLEILAVRIAP